ncbi:hypothetical protein [Ruegeria intermedia]|nr:hypothetical protein [Ruegeria intermedia]
MNDAAEGVSTGTIAEDWGPFFFDLTFPVAQPKDIQMEVALQLSLLP